MKKLSNHSLLMVAVLTMIAFAGSAEAAVTNFTLNVSGMGQVSGIPVAATVLFTYDDVSGLLTINISNTGTAGSIVGAGFNTPGTRSAASGSVTVQPTGGSMIPVNSAGGPFAGSGAVGSFEFGIATTTSIPFSSGNTTQGIQPGESATATFIISSPGGINAASFAAALNAANNGVLLRFSGVSPADPGDSVNAVGRTTVTPTPEPTTFLLLGAGLLALGLANRRKN